MLHIQGLNASVEGNKILKNLDLDIGPGEVHAVMGPNGAGKSTLAAVLAGRDVFKASGTVEFNGQDLLGLEPEERAAAGIFLAFQYPTEIPGVGNMYFLRTAVNALREARGEELLDARQFITWAKSLMAELNMNPALLSRSVNSGFSGGEKKRNEVLQMAMMEPKLAILDETDSGLDIDALKIVSDGVNRFIEDKDKGVLLITHYTRILRYITPDYVHVFVDGRIADQGGPELADQLEAEGYDKYVKATV